ncbi:hypothetical protein ACIQKE_07185 [Streptomyces griseoviridis]
MQRPVLLFALLLPLTGRGTDAPSGGAAADADKAVLHVEYEIPTSRSCPGSRELKPSSMPKRYEPGGWHRAC